MANPFDQFEQPSGNPFDKFDAVSARKTPKGFFERMGERLGETSEDLSATYERFALPETDPRSQGLGSTLLQTVGAGFGTAGDVIGETTVSGFRALPDAIEMPIREAASKAAQGVAGTRIGQEAIQAVKSGAEAYQAFAGRNPVAAANIESAVDIGSFLPIARPVKQAAKTVGNVAVAAAQPLGRLAGSLAGKVDDTLKPLAQKAVEFDIPLRFDQVKPSQMNATLQKVSQSMPLSGTAAFEDAQRTAWNQALAKTIGADDLTPNSINKFRKQNASMFDDVLRQNKINVSKNDLDSLRRVQKLDVFDLTPGDLQIVNRDIKKTLSDLTVGEVSGQKIASARSYLADKSLRAGNATPFYQKLIDQLDTIARKSLSPDDVKKLDTARRQYRNFKTMQPLLQEGMEIDPVRLMQRVSSNKYIDASSIATGQDDLVDLARIGKHLLKKQGGSDTFEKAAFMGGLGSLGTYGLLGNPVTAGAIGGTMLGGNRALQAGVLRNQALMRQMAGAPRQPLSFSQINQMSPRDAMILLGGGAILGQEQ